MDDVVTYEKLMKVVKLLEDNDCPTGIVYAYLTTNAAKVLGHTDYEEVGDGIVKVTIHNKRIQKNG